jgi:hypothetical protein
MPRVPGLDPGPGIRARSRAHSPQQECGAGGAIMSISRPFRRTVRQLKDGSYANSGNGRYVLHPKYAIDPQHYVASSRAVAGMPPSTWSAVSSVTGSSPQAIYGASLSATLMQ